MSGAFPSGFRTSPLTVVSQFTVLVSRKWLLCVASPQHVHLLNYAHANEV